MGVAALRASGDAARRELFRVLRERRIEQTIVIGAHGPYRAIIGCEIVTVGYVDFVYSLLFSLPLHCFTITR
jgi:hypothetical protein